MALRPPSSTRLFVLAALTFGAVALLLPLHAGATFRGENGDIAFQSFESIYKGNFVFLCGSVLNEPACFSPAYSPDGDRIAYEQSGHVVVQDVATGTTTQLPNAGTPSSWSPDGDKIYLTSPGVTWVDAAGSGESEQIVPFGSNPDVAFNGKIAFECDGICVANTNGKNVTQLLSEPTAHGPSWSGNGKLIAFTADLDGLGPSIYTMTPRGTDIHQLVPFHDVFFPVWSPDSEKIVFAGNPVRGEAPCFSIQNDCYFVVDSDSTDLTVVGTEQFDFNRPSWQALR